MHKHELLACTSQCQAPTVNRPVASLAQYRGGFSLVWRHELLPYRGRLCSSPRTSQVQKKKIGRCFWSSTSSHSNFMLCIADSSNPHWLFKLQIIQALASQYTLRIFGQCHSIIVHEDGGCIEHKGDAEYSVKQFRRQLMGFFFALSRSGILQLDHQ